MDTLYHATGRNGFCGPVALSATFGLPTHEASALIRHIRKDGRPVKSVVPVDLAAAASLLAGRKIALTHYGDWHGNGSPLPTLGQWAEKHLPANVPAIVDTAYHFVAMLKTAEGIQVADSGAWFSRKPALWDGNTKRRSRVKSAMLIEGMEAYAHLRKPSVAHLWPQRAKRAAKPKAPPKVHYSVGYQTLCGRTITANLLTTTDDDGATCSLCKDIDSRWEY